MNRNTFLKSLAATVAAPFVPVPVGTVGALDVAPPPPFPFEVVYALKEMISDYAGPFYFYTREAFGDPDNPEYFLSSEPVHLRSVSDILEVISDERFDGFHLPTSANYKWCYGTDSPYYDTLVRLEKAADNYRESLCSYARNFGIPPEHKDRFSRYALLAKPLRSLRFHWAQHPKSRHPYSLLIEDAISDQDAKTFRLFYS
jgi:hypothetical protein